MTENKKEFLRKSQFPLAAALAIAPIPQLVYVIFAPKLVPLFWVLPLAYFLLSLLNFRIPGKFRMLYGIAASLVLIGVGAAVMLIVPSFFLLIAPIPYIVTMMLTLPMAGWGADKELPPFWLYCGFATHIFTYIIKFLLKAAWGVNWDAINPCLSITFFGTAILVMLSLTRVNLNNSANGRQKPSEFMQQKNLIFTAIFFVLAMLIALIPAIYEVLETACSWLITTIQNWIESIEIDQIINDMGDSSSPPPEQNEGVPFVDSLLRQLLDILFILVAIVALYLILKTLIPPIIRRIRNLFNKLHKGLTSYAASVSEDYIDEVTDLHDTVTKVKGPRLSSAEERSLPPQERIRYRYRRLLSKHPAWTRGSTARENLPELASPLYEKARYSNHPITEEDADAFKANTRRV